METSQGDSRRQEIGLSVVDFRAPSLPDIFESLIHWPDHALYSLRWVASGTTKVTGIEASSSSSTALLWRSFAKTEVGRSGKSELSLTRFDHNELMVVKNITILLSLFFH